MNTSGHSPDSQYDMFVSDFLKSYFKLCILSNSLSFLWIVSVSIYYKIGFSMFMELLATAYAVVNLFLILSLIVVLILSYIFYLTCKKLGLELFKYDYHQTSAEFFSWWDTICPSRFGIVRSRITQQERLPCRKTKFSFRKV